MMKDILTNKMLILCVVCMIHDLAEAIVGDITPHCNVSKEEKRQLEEVTSDMNNCLYSLI